MRQLRANSLAKRVGLGLAGALAAVLCGGLVFGAAGAGQAIGDAEKLKFFEAEVRPILAQHCVKCHGGEEKIKGGLRLTSRAAALKGGDLGQIVVPGEPGKSLLVEAINYKNDKLQMPPKGKLPQAQIDVLTRWVEMGLPWTPGADEHAEASAPTRVEKKATIEEEIARWWAYQPVRRPDVPAVKDAAWVKNPIDAFVLAKLEANDLKPAPPADKLALLRRAYYDLTGLPPTPKDVEAFLTDSSPGAFAKVVDRLLASPQYGEKWGRHWLDLVRYAETNGYERDNPKPSVWRYRDYVIDAFNKDKPYDRFVVEQLAGDELPDASHETLVATGYYRLGLWDDEPVDKMQAYYDSLDDVVSTTGSVFLASTVGCARCHDHKIDPIPARDYYRFTAFFHNIKVGQGRAFEFLTTTPLAGEDELKPYREKEKELAAQVETLEKKVKAFEERIYESFSGPEKDDAKDEATRRLLLRKKAEQVLSPAEREEFAAARREMMQLRRAKLPELPQALVVKEDGPTPRPTHVLIRGSAHAKGDEVKPGLPLIFGGAEPAVPEVSSAAQSTGRRLALARWIVTEPNRTAARVMANRIWQFHFDRGIVDSPSDFGKAGTAPTHPELLDWLADEFVQKGWSVKAMHRLIMASSTYQMSAAHSAAPAAKDPDNKLFWRFNMRRLTAEEVRDSILAVNGTLNPKMGGPSVYTKVPDAVLQTASRPDAAWGRSSPEDQARRSVYVHVKRSLREPILNAFDAADTDSTCAVRFVTTVPTQSLTSLNSEFYHEQARQFADRLKKEAGEDRAAQVRLAFRLAAAREATEAEVEKSLDLMKSWQAEDGVEPDRALAYFCLMVLNLNEFVYLD